MDFKQNHHRSWKYYIQKLLLSKVFFTKVIKTHDYFFCEKKRKKKVLFNFFMTQTIADNCWGLRKNLNCVFPLKFLNVNKNQFKGF